MRTILCLQRFRASTPQRQEELDRTLRAQALELLRQGRAARGVAPRLAEALIAFYDRDFAIPPWRRWCCGWSPTHRRRRPGRCR